ncbi:prevent-host-death family protein [Silvibacterium bohemicum]|uniref:Antitoxin n=2 Tax=Silvibacterium bohemicum TaxID=1577686 RepID=A0A841K140_9BACT|nr:prevent-host-death family protein [Silvibacterium bohemicum]
MKTMPAGKFKAQCLAVIDEVHERGEEVVITKHGKPMARLVPLTENQEKPDDIFGFMLGKGRITGDIVSPIFKEEEWDEDVFPPGFRDESK